MNETLWRWQSSENRVLVDSQEKQTRPDTGLETHLILICLADSHTTKDLLFRTPPLFLCSKTHTGVNPTPTAVSQRSSSLMMPCWLSLLLKWMFCGMQTTYSEGDNESTPAVPKIPASRHVIPHVVNSNAARRSDTGTMSEAVSSSDGTSMYMTSDLHNVDARGAAILLSGRRSLPMYSTRNPGFRSSLPLELQLQRLPNLEDQSSTSQQQSGRVNG